MPALYGAFLSPSGEPASVLTHGIWVLAATSILSVFALTRAFWGISPASWLLRSGRRCR